MNTAVLLLAFNRPDTTARVFAAIRKARPARLYVAVDGPRSLRRGEDALCAEVRRIVSAVDWPCTAHTLFRDSNLGCKRAVSSAIDWFFSHEKQGIILEDDCLPSISFFTFCEQMLDRHRDDKRVFAIQGNFFGGVQRGARPSSYVFSKMFYMWGWATWADRWRSVSIDRVDVPASERAIREENWVGSSFMLKDYWLDLVRRQAAGSLDSWGYSVMFHCFGNHLFNVTPTRNLVLNIGDGPSATRTTSLDCGPHHSEALEMDFPLVDCQPYEGAEQLLRFEHRWRIQLRRATLAKWWMHRRYPRLYGLFRKLVDGTSSKSSAA